MKFKTILINGKEYLWRVVGNALFVKIEVKKRLDGDSIIKMVKAGTDHRSTVAKLIKYIWG